ncbi:MAG: N-acetylneuraminic acid mutarotase [Marivirga sp.]
MVAENQLSFTDSWKYNQENDSWSEISKYPRVISGSAATVFKGEAYVAFGRLYSQEKMDNKIFIVMNKMMNGQESKTFLAPLILADRAGQ